MGAEILIVDDEAAIADLVEVYLKNEGYTVHKFDNAADALACVERDALDLAILDVMLPDMDGFTLCQKIRERHLFPILMLTAKVEDMDKITGLTLGADDYITKPFSMRELMARVKANIRRSTMAPADSAARPTSGRLELGRIAIDTELLMAYKDGAPLDLTQREYELLKFLASNPGKVFSREALMENVWNYEGYVGDVRAVDVAVRRLREKVEDDPAAPQFVVTRRGLGYLFNI